MSEEAKTYSLRHTLERPHVNWWGVAAFIIAGEGGIRLLAFWSLHKLQEAFSPDITFAECYCGASLLFLLLFGKPAIIGCIRIYQRYAPESVRRKCTCKPSCSEYAILALRKHGLWTGLYKSYIRLTRTCRNGQYLVDYP